VCRSLLVKAQIEALRAKNEATSEKMLGKTVQALAVLAQAVEPVRKIAKYSHLVYNASLLFWRIARPVLREGSLAQMVPHLKVVVKALDEQFPDSLHLWRARLHTLLARCLDEARQVAETAAVAQQAWSLSAKSKEAGAGAVALRIEAIRLLVHANRANQESLARVKNELVAPSFKELRPQAVLQ
jgi:pantoate kinase